MAHVVSPQAEADLEEIWYYVATQSGTVEAADRSIDSLTHRFFLLASHPYIGRVRDEDFGSGSRSFPVGDYVIVYRVEGEDVWILRVAHGRRDIEALFGH
jgi:toxin ParE1/3/4